MKLKRLFQWIFVFLMVFIPAASTSEKMSIDPIAVSKTKPNLSSIPVDTSISENDKLTVKAGLVFTQGGNYSGMILPYLISNPKPILYPRWAVKQGWQGRFVIAIEVLIDGSVGRYKVMESTGYRILDNVATEAVRTWKFHPAMKDGKLMVTCIDIPVTFELEDL